MDLCLVVWFNPPQFVKPYRVLVAQMGICLQEAFKRFYSREDFALPFLVVKWYLLNRMLFHVHLLWRQDLQTWACCQPNRTDETFHGVVSSAAFGLIR